MLQTLFFNYEYIHSFTQYAAQLFVDFLVLKKKSAALPSILFIVLSLNNRELSIFSGINPLHSVGFKVNLTF